MGSKHTPVQITNQYKNVLCTLNKNGNVQFYSIFIEKPDEKAPQHYRLLYRFKQMGFNGVITRDVELISEGKNIGKANETTPEQQAEIMANSFYNKVLDRGYKELKDIKFRPTAGGMAHAEEKFKSKIFDMLKSSVGTDASGELKPMKCQDFDIRKANWPCHVQPKLDGCRCFVKNVNGEIVYSSRNGKIFTTLNHISKVLLRILPEGVILDGEVYLHGQTFQTIVSALKAYREDVTPLLQFHVFDIADDQELWPNRLGRLKTLIPEKNKFVKLVETEVIANEMEMREKFSRYLGDGYEGAIIRYWDGHYEFNRRSYRVVKYKEFDEQEFKITGVEGARGRDAGTAIFILKTKDGKIFKARPQGSFELRAEYLTNSKKYIGKKATVRFQGLTDLGVPRFPSLKTIRDYE